ncbi:MAG: hypothetical protein OHK0024_27380 [Thalassobaculales bacterium]
MRPYRLHVPPPAITPDEMRARAGRFRERVAGMRHALANPRLPPDQRAELERMARNLEAAAVALDKMARGKT